MGKSGKMQSFGSSGSGSMPGIGMINTENIKGDKDGGLGIGSGQGGSGIGNGSGTGKGIGALGSGDDDSEGDGSGGGGGPGGGGSGGDGLGQGGIGAVISSSVGDGGNDKSTSGGKGMPTLAQGGNGKNGRSQVPGLGYLSSDKGGTSRALSFPMHYRANKTQTRELTMGMITMPKEDVMPLSTYIGTYFFTKKYYLLSVNGIIYRNTTQFTLPANIEMEVSDQYLLKDSNKKE